MTFADTGDGTPQEAPPTKCGDRCGPEPDGHQRMGKVHDSVAIDGQSDAEFGVLCRAEVWVEAPDGDIHVPSDPERAAGDTRNAAHQVFAEELGVREVQKVWVE